jgi:hypothetical protein
MRLFTEMGDTTGQGIGGDNHATTATTATQTKRAMSLHG